MTDSDLNAEHRALAAEVVSGTLTLEEAAERAGVPNSTVARWVSQLIFASTPSLQSRARTLITVSQPQVEVVRPVEVPAAPESKTAGLSSADATTPTDVEVAEVATGDESERESYYERPTLPRARPEVDEQAYTLVALTSEQSGALQDIDARLLSALDGTRSVKQIFDAHGLDPDATREQVQRLLTLGYLVPSSLKPVSVSVAPSAAAQLSYTSIPPFKPQRSRLAWTAAVTALGAAVTVGYLKKTELAVFAGFIPKPPPKSYAAKPLAPPTSVTLVEATLTDLHIVAPKPAAPNAGCPENMVFIPPGKFTMGVDSNASQLVHSKPVHDVQFEHGFCIHRTEVTVAEYDACVESKNCTQASALAHWARGNTKPDMWAASRRLHSQQCNGGNEDKANHPINCISWPQANTYCKAQGFELPSEQQWEYAARGAAARSYPWGNEQPNSSMLNGCGKECDDWHTTVGLHSEVSSVLYASDDGFFATAPVGSFAAGATPEGVLDLAGNVAEWTANWFYDYSDMLKLPSPERPTNGGYHVVRGGSFSSTSLTHVDSALRTAVPNPTFSHAIGFRCVAASQ
jgi:formylglycine-generating enzyme